MTKEIYELFCEIAIDAMETGRTFYGVYRIRDINDIDHSGNRETRGGWYETREEAERLAETLNEEDK